MYPKRKKRKIAEVRILMGMYGVSESDRIMKLIYKEFKCNGHRWENTRKQIEMV